MSNENPGYYRYEPRSPDSLSYTEVVQRDLAEPEIEEYRKQYQQNIFTTPRQAGKAARLSGDPGIQMSERQLIYWLEDLVFNSVVGWRMHRRFNYAAIKINLGNGNKVAFYTTSTIENTIVPQVCTIQDMAHLLSHDKTDGVMYASTWAWPGE